MFATWGRRERDEGIDAAGPSASVPLRKPREAGVMEQGDVERSLSFAHIVLRV